MSRASKGGGTSKVRGQSKSGAAAAAAEPGSGSIGEAMGELYSRAVPPGAGCTFGACNCGGSTNFAAVPSTARPEVSAAWAERLAWVEAATRRAIEAEVARIMVERRTVTVEAFVALVDDTHDLFLAAAARMAELVRESGSPRDGAP